MSLNKLMLISTTGIVGCCVAVTLFQSKLSESLLETPSNREVLEKVKAHKGAIHFLGEPIEPTSAKYNNLSMKTDGYSEVKVQVTGPKSKGIVFYTLVEDEQKQNAVLKSIQLQIGKDDTKRLVIFESQNNKSVSEMS